MKFPDVYTSSNIYTNIVTFLEKHSKGFIFFTGEKIPRLGFLKLVTLIYKASEKKKNTLKMSFLTAQENAFPNLIFGVFFYPPGCISNSLGITYG